MSDRERGVTVYPLKSDWYLAEKNGASTWDRYVLGINPNTNEIYLIHNPEGVGYAVHHNKPWRFNDNSLYAKWFSVYEVLNMVDWDTPLDLADVIRTSGSRLEANFAIMHYRLTSDKPMLGGTIMKMNQKRKSHKGKRTVYTAFHSDNKVCKVAMTTGDCPRSHRWIKLDGN